MNQPKGSILTRYEQYAKDSTAVVIVHNDPHHEDPNFSVIKVYFDKNEGIKRELVGEFMEETEESAVRFASTYYNLVANFKGKLIITDHRKRTEYEYRPFTRLQTE